jgi:hypothetical protein
MQNCLIYPCPVCLGRNQITILSKAKFLNGPLFSFFWLDLGLKSGPHASKADALPLKPCLQPPNFCMILNEASSKNTSNKKKSFIYGKYLLRRQTEGNHINWL